MKQSFKLVIICLITMLLLGSALSAQARKAQSSPDLSALNSRIQWWVDQKYYPGAGLFIAQGDRVLCEKYFGNYTPDTVVYIASAGKWLGVATIASLVDDGILSWDDTPAKWLPEFANDPKGKVTLRQMYSHTSGYPNYQPDGNHPDNYQTCAESTANVLPLPLTYATGTRFDYGGLAMQVAGRMAEVATGKDWETLFQERIARPLEMKNAHFTPVDPGHIPMIGGGARCSLPDYANFITMIAHNGVYKGKRILSEAVLHEMQADQVGKAYVQQPEFAERVRGATHNGIYGLGEWREIVDDNNEAILLSSPSWAGAYPWYDKASGVYGVFITHVDTSKANGFSGFWASPVLSMMARQAAQAKPDPIPVKRGVVNVGDANLYYEEAGKGSETIILVHAHSVDRRMWDKQFYEYAKKYHVIRYDLRGYGLSDMPASVSKDNLAEGKAFLHAEDLHNLMQKLGVKKAHLVGLSLGAPVLIDMMILHPEEVASASLASGGLFKFIHTYNDAEKKQRLSEIDALRVKGINAYKKEWYNGLMNNTGSQRETMRADLWKMIDEWQAWQPLHIEPQLLLGVDAEARLKEKTVTVPVQFLVASRELKDGKFAPAEELLELIPGSTKVVIEDSGHFSNMEQPKAFNKAVLSFIKKVSK